MIVKVSNKLAITAMSLNCPLHVQSLEFYLTLNSFLISHFLSCVCIYKMLSSYYFTCLRDKGTSRERFRCNYTYIYLWWFFQHDQVRRIFPCFVMFHTIVQMDVPYFPNYLIPLCPTLLTKIRKCDWWTMLQRK